MVLREKTQNFVEKHSANVTLSTINATSTDLGSNSCVHGVRLASNRLVQEIPRDGL
jgi:hypothetical protein